MTYQTATAWPTSGTGWDSKLPSPPDDVTTRVWVLAPPLRLLRGILADHHLDDLLPAVAEPHPRPARRAVIMAMHRAHLRIEAAWPEDRPFAPMSARTAER